jgi:Icc-related predicted phosphoesterase
MTRDSGDGVSTGGGREVRVAAVGDIHYEAAVRGKLRSIFTEIEREADILAIAGDLTTHGQAEQVRGLVDEMEGFDRPIVAVLGNHDHESGEEEEISSILADRGVHLLDGGSVEIDGVGFAGVKGFGGGFDRRTLGPFGEAIYKAFVDEALKEAMKLETALRTLQTEVKVALLHYSPLRDTLEGEPLEIFPFLGTSRLLHPIETYAPDVVFHGHAHKGAPEGRTPSGIPVYNVAATLLEEVTGRPYRIWTARAPDRRQDG